MDPHGASVPGAQVQANRLGTGVSSTSVTNGSGVYFLTGLQPGRYQLVVRKQGFKEAVVDELVLSVQGRREQNFTLTVGSVSETVNVAAEKPVDEKNVGCDVGGRPSH